MKKDLEEFAEKRVEGYLLSEDFLEIIGIDSFLLHGITVTQRDGIVLKGLMVNRDTVGSTDGVLTAIALTYRVLLVYLTCEIETQLMLDLASLFRKAVFLHER